MTNTTRPLHDHQQRALAAASGLVGRPRLRAGLALTLAFACAPLPGDDGDDGQDGGDDTTLADASTSLAPDTDAPSTGLDDASTTDPGGAAGSGTDAGGTGTTAGTLLTDASTTLASDTGDATTGDMTGTGDSTGTGDATGTGGTTGELDDCVLDPRTGEMDWACCEAQDWLPAPQCTPWGPPAPPTAARMRQARAARRVLA